MLPQLENYVVLSVLMSFPLIALTVHLAQWTVWIDFLSTISTHVSYVIIFFFLFEPQLIIKMKKDIAFYGSFK